MTPASIVHGVQADGLAMALTPLGTIKVVGDRVALDRWAPIIRDSKAGIVDVLARCQGGQQQAYYLEQARQVPPPPEPDYTATCGACRHFQRIDHPNLGHCTKGEPEALAGLWDTDQRWCMRYEASNHG